MFLKGENEEGFMEDDQGVMVGKRANLKTWLGKMFTPEYSHNSLGRNSPCLSASSKNLDLSNSQKQWEHYVQEIETYLEHLLSSNLDEEICGEENDIVQTGPVEPDMPKNADATMVSKYHRYFCSMWPIILYPPKKCGHNQRCLVGKLYYVSSSTNPL